MRLRRLFWVLAVGAAALVTGAVPVAAQPPVGQLSVETGYYEGHTVTFLQPSVTSSNPNQGQFACFQLGPDLSGGNRAATAPPLYVIIAPGATQHSCPDGSLRHDHVLSAAPGSPGYTAAWSLVLVLPTDAFVPAEMPFTSVAAVQAAAAAGHVTLVETGVRMIAPVVGGA
jgi:hypothetical protein